MNLTKFARSLLLASLVAIVAVGGVSTLPGISVFVQCTDGGVGGVGGLGNPDFCRADSDGVGTADNDFINGSDDADFINATGVDISGLGPAGDGPRWADMDDDEAADFNGAGGVEETDTEPGGDDTVIANGGDDNVATDGQDTVMLGDGDDEASTGPETDNVFPGPHARDDVAPGTAPENVRSFTQDGFVSQGGDVSLYTGDGDDKVWVNAGEVTGVLVIDCGAGNNDSVNFVGFGSTITAEDQTQSRQVDSTTGGEIYTINCENLNGLAANN